MRSLLLFELVSVTELDGRWHYPSSGAGEVFSAVRSELNREMERELRKMVREILEEDLL